MASGSRESTLSLIISLLMFILSDVFVGGSSAASLEMELSLSSSPSHETSSHIPLELSKIIADDHDGDFKLTEEMINFLDSTLNQFGTSESIDLSMSLNDSPISTWLTAQNGGNRVVGSPLAEKMAHDLDFVYANYGNKLRPLIQTIIMDKPHELNAANLAFRCERHAELMQIQQLASTSTIYRITIDVFFSELYVHCLTRKFATIKLLNIEPSSILRQFVDLYLDLPMILQSNSGSNSPMAETYRQLALRGFNLEESIRRHGPMDKAVELVLDGQSMMSFGRDSVDTRGILSKFVNECQNFTAKLSEVWGQFDSVPSFFSSPMSNLVEFNEMMKSSAPQLLYATICNQLMSTLGQ